MAHKIKNAGDDDRRSTGVNLFRIPAEITLLKQDPQAGDPLSRLNFTVGGSIRPQFNMMSGDGDKGSYKRNGFDGGTRFRFAADYYLFDDISWISYYELGSIFRHCLTGITTMRKAPIIRPAVCCTPG